MPSPPQNAPKFQGAQKFAQMDVDSPTSEPPPVTKQTNNTARVEEDSRPTYTPPLEERKAPNASATGDAAGRMMPSQDKSKQPDPVSDQGCKCVTM